VFSLRARRIGHNGPYLLSISRRSRDRGRRGRADTAQSVVVRSAISIPRSALSQFAQKGFAVAARCLDPVCEYLRLFACTNGLLSFVYLATISMLASIRALELSLRAAGHAGPHLRSIFGGWRKRILPTRLVHRLPGFKSPFSKTFFYSQLYLTPPQRTWTHPGSTVFRGQCER
jgi:hypothetical protein